MPFIIDRLYVCTESLLIVMYKAHGSEGYHKGLTTLYSWYSFILSTEGLRTF